ncbi:MAG: TonB-dependent receptor [Cyclobacteriaceae bacterium]
MSRLCIYCMVTHLSVFTFAFATDSDAQTQSVEEIKVNVTLTNPTTLDKVLELIELATNFEFSHIEQEFNPSSYRLELDAQEYLLGDLLRNISRKTGLSFKRVNNNIFIRKQEKDAAPLTEEIQTATISGKVTDETGEPLPGATVLEKGTNNGTITDIKGNFSINVSEDATLLVSFVGYKAQEIALNGQNSIEISLIADYASLEEVVVVGYGATKKKDLTGSVSSIGSEILENRQSVQVSDALQGTMAGVTVTRNNSKPGSGSNIMVRGVTSLNVNDPLVIVDGVPGLQLNDINPGDIESISVLKDAASQAIYGARAAAGVIVVTTKRGSQGKPQFSYNYEFGFSSPTQSPKYVDAQTYRILYNEASVNDGGGEIWDATENENYQQLHAENPDKYPDTNWQDLMLAESPTNRHRHDMSVALGQENLSTRASLSYVSEDGLYAGFDYDRYTLRVNNNLKINNILSFNVDLYYKNAQTTDPNDHVDGSVIIAARRYPGVYNAIRTDGQYGQGKDGINPYADLLEGGYTDMVENSYNGVIGLTLSPIEGLNIKANFSPTISTTDVESFDTPPYILREGTVDEYWPQEPLTLSESTSTFKNMTRQVTANYQTAISDFKLDLLGGYEEVGVVYESTNAVARNLYVKLPSLGFGDPALAVNGQTARENTLRSFFGRVNLNYQDKYLIQSNLRYDGSSRFSKDNRWGLFPSASLGWVVSNESFDLPSFISFLKLRASYGEVGNERVGSENSLFNYYPYQALFGRTNTPIYTGGSIVAGLGVNQSFLADEQIQWETTKTLDYGVVLGFLEDRVNVEVDYYKKTTEDIILSLDIPDYLGFTDNTKTNVGSMTAKGLDVELSYQNQIGQLRYQAAFNISHVSTEVLNVGGREDFTTNGGATINIKNRAYNEWYGFESNGIYTTQEEADAYGANGKAGNVWLIDQLTVDTDGDGIFDARDSVINEQDRMPLGPSIPEIVYGGSISLEYKGLDLSLIFQGVGKQQLRSAGYQITPFQSTFGNVPTVLIGDIWRPGNTDAENANVTYPRYSLSTPENYYVSQHWLFNGSYFRVKNITLGYTLPNELTSKFEVDRLRFYVGLRDYFTIAPNFIEGWDPEVSNESYPILKSVLFGLNVKF